MHSVQLPTRTMLHCPVIDFTINEHKKRKDIDSFYIDLIKEKLKKSYENRFFKAFF